MQYVTSLHVIQRTFRSGSVTQMCKFLLITLMIRKQSKVKQVKMLSMTTMSKTLPVCSKFKIKREITFVLMRNCNVLSLQSSWNIANIASNFPLLFLNYYSMSYVSRDSNRLVYTKQQRWYKRHNNRNWGHSRRHR